MSKVPTFGVHQLTTGHMQETQRRLLETQMQISTGKVARDYLGVAVESRRLVSLEGSLREIKGFSANITTTQSRLQAMELSVSGVFDVASDFRTLLVTALNLDNASQLSLAQRAEAFIAEAAGMLNVREGDRYLFAGGRIGQPPIDTAVLLSDEAPLVNTAEFTGLTTNAGTGITGFTGISSVKTESGNSGDAFQLTYDSVTETFTMTNLNGGASANAPLGTPVLPGQTRDFEFSLGGERVVVTVDGSFDPGVSVATDTITGVVDTGGFGAGAFGPITVQSTAGDIGEIDRNVIETSGTAASATLTLSSSDGDFVATGVDLSTPAAAIPVTLVNATTGAEIRMQIDVATGFNDAAVSSNDTEIRLNNFLRNVAVSTGAVDAGATRPTDLGYDPANPSFYRGDDARLTARIDISATVSYGVTADEAGFEKLFRALFMVKEAAADPTNINRETLETALALSLEAIEDIPDIRSRIGADLLTLDRVQSRHQDVVVYTGEAISNIENVDVAAAVATLAAQETQLEASFLVTSRLSQLTLLNFLR